MFQLSSLFHLTTGSVIAMKSLDRERDSTYSLVISCRDMGNPHLTSPTSLRLDIKVLDENDNAPVFNAQQYSATIKENTPIGSTILFMNITDPDAGKNGMFNVSMIKLDGKNVFGYDSQTSALVLTGKLDFEKTAVYQFTVIAKDFGSPSLEKSAAVCISLNHRYALASSFPFIPDDLSSKRCMNSRDVETTGGTGDTCPPRFCNKQRSAFFIFRNSSFSLI